MIAPEAGPAIQRNRGFVCPRQDRRRLHRGSLGGGRVVKCVGDEHAPVAGQIERRAEVCVQPDGPSEFGFRWTVTSRLLVS